MEINNVKFNESIERAAEEQEKTNIKDDSSIPFISMKKENIILFKDSIKKVGDDYIFLFDIDDTIYKSSEKFHQNQIKSFYEAYDKLREKAIKDGKTIPPVDVALKENALYTETFFKYFDITPIQLEAFREQCDYSEFLEKDEEVRNMLLSIPFRKWAFTNGLKSRADPILEVLGLKDCFEGVICFDDDSREIIGKPKDSAFEFVEELLGIENKQKVFFFDDALINIKTGERFGWRSIHVRKEDCIIELVNDVLKDIKY
ncbi:hypothetical protein NGRA_1276 [Nosema granulosis]|uniref:Pyrimidine 5-nucleotidase n=1 Tax=Nosema granulosis TaxID=83296 RepID=A0A9P6GYR8_9MICR|nr:hypothetical protein NGRA_1276 [Nosema granulosis]